MELKNIFLSEFRNTFIRIQKHICVRIQNVFFVKIREGCARVAGVGWLSGTAAESLRAFVERVFANFRDKSVVFYNCGKTGHLWLSKDLHTQRHIPSDTLFDV